MRPPTALSASRKTAASRQTCLIVARYVFAAPVSSCFADDKGAGSNGPPVCVNRVMIRKPRSAFDRCHDLSDEGVGPPLQMQCEAHQEADKADRRITVVLQIQFKSLGGEDRCASSRPSLRSCERHCGSLQQENSTDPPPLRPGNPEAVLVAADEECRNGVADYAGIERGWRHGPKPSRSKVCGIEGER